MLAVPRERFVPAPLRGIAYVDEDIPLGGGRYLMEPMVLGRLLQTARSGPATSCLMSAAVPAMPARHGAVGPRRRRARGGSGTDAAGAVLVTELGLPTVAVVEGKLAAGCPAGRPTMSSCQRRRCRHPPVIAQQLADGGRLLAVVQAMARWARRC